MKQLINVSNTQCRIICDDSQLIEDQDYYRLITEDYKMGMFFRKDFWTVEDFNPKSEPLYYIKGVSGRGDEVLELLEKSGGVNSEDLSGDCKGLYFIDGDNVINYCTESQNDITMYRMILKYGQEIHLPKSYEELFTKETHTLEEWVEIFHNDPDLYHRFEKKLNY